MRNFEEVRIFAWHRVWLFFKFTNPTPVQTPASIMDPTVIYPCFYLRNDHADSSYCRNAKVTPGPVFHKFLNQGPKEKRGILPESTPDLRIRCHPWQKPATRLFFIYTLPLDSKCITEMDANHLSEN